jgi:hypothetical protein
MSSRFRVGATLLSLGFSYSIDDFRFRHTSLPEHPSFQRSSCNNVPAMPLTTVSLTPCYTCTAGDLSANDGQLLAGPNWPWVSFSGFRRRPEARCWSPCCFFSAPTGFTAASFLGSSSRSAADCSSPAFASIIVIMLRVRRQENLSRAGSGAHRTTYPGLLPRRWSCRGMKLTPLAII